MKNNIIRLVVISAFLPMLAFAQTVTDTVSDQIDCAVITHALKLGSRDASTGGDVTTLQTYLSQANFLDADPTGYFGKATKKAVQDFQTANGITPLGSVGPYTRTKIKEVSCTDSNANTTSVNTTPVVNTNTQVVDNPSATVNTVTNQATTNTITNQTTNTVTPTVSTVKPTPSVTVTFPNGGEGMSIGYSNDVDFMARWTSSNLYGTAHVYLNSIDGSMCLLGSVPVSQGYFPVSLGINHKCPNNSNTINAGQYKIVIATDTASPTGDQKGINDSSNNYFNLLITAPVSTQPPIDTTVNKLSILYPNGGEVLNYGQSTWISWTPDTYTGSYDVSIRGVSSGNIYNVSQNVQSQTTDKLSVAWTPTANSYEKDTVFVARVCKSGTQICSESASNFTIPNSYSKPVILYPNNGEVLLSGITQYISWTPQNSSGSFDVAIIGVYSGNEYWIKQNVSNAATDKLSVSWIPTAGSYEKDSVFKVRVCITGTTICGESQNNFSVKF